MEQPVNEMMQDDQFANEFHYKSCGTSLEDLGRSQRKWPKTRSKPEPTSLRIRWLQQDVVVKTMSDSRCC
jgi:hypothetical protein